ncbi:MAG TPA: hypothetical protein VII61_14855, partial [Ktedonobacteraceae bacterium]
YFLSIYKEFLLLEFHHADEQALLQALWVLGEIVFQDGEVEDAIRTLADDRRLVVRESARLMLAKFP